MKIKLYHCSFKHWKVGDLIYPHIDGREYSGGRGIYCTTSPEPHYTLTDNGENSLSKGMKLFKVRPIKNKIKRGLWDDIVCPYGVEVIESLGDAPRSGNFSKVYYNNLQKPKRFKFKRNRCNFLVYDSNTKKLIRGFRNFKYALNYCIKNNKNILTSYYIYNLNTFKKYYVDTK